jgi:hypothetical protein
VVVVEKPSRGPPAPVDDVHEMSQSMVDTVTKWYPSTGDVDDEFRYVYEHSPGAAGTYGASGLSPPQLTGPGPSGSPESNVRRVGVAMTVAQTGPIEALTDTDLHESLLTRKSSGTWT